MTDSNDPKTGLKKGPTNYGDIEFSLFLRKAFIKGAGYTDDALSRSVVGTVTRAEQCRDFDFLQPVESTWHRSQSKHEGLRYDFASGFQPPGLH